MKKVFLPVFILTWVVVLSGFWIIQPGDTNSSTLELIFIGVILLLLILGIYFSYGRIKRKKEGFPEEDELSRIIERKAAAISYYLSIILWLALIFIQSNISIELKWVFSIGMIGMALLFVISWVIINIKES